MRSRKESGGGAEHPLNIDRTWSPKKWGGYKVPQPPGAGSYDDSPAIPLDCKTNTPVRKAPKQRILGFHILLCEIKTGSGVKQKGRY